MSQRENQHIVIYDMNDDQYTTYDFTSKGTYVMQLNPNLQSYSWNDNMCLQFTIAYYFQNISTSQHLSEDSRISQGN